MSKDVNLIIDEAIYFVSNHSTVRDTAKHFDVSKSKVHKDLCSDELKKYDYKLYNDVRNLLNNNFMIKHIRGGLSTKYKYLNLK